MGESIEVMFCRICLRIDLTQKYYLSDIPQRKFIEKFFKENGYDKALDKHSYACFECRAVLHRFYNFLQKALRAQKVLYELQDKPESLTYDLLQSIDREEHNITSNLLCRESETYDFPSLNPIPEDVIIKSEPNDVQDDNLATNDPIAQNDPDIHDLDLSTTSENDQQNYRYIDPYTKEVTTVDPEFIPNLLKNSYLEPSSSGVVIKTEPEVSIIEGNAIKKFRKGRKHKQAKKVEKHSSDSDDTYKPNKVKKRKGTKKKTDNDTPSSEKVKRKRIKVEWPKQPVFEEKFRERKNVKYRGLDARNESDEDFMPSGDSSVESSSDGSCHSYDEKGRKRKKQTDKREFPMKCEECESIISSRVDHHHHYMLMHKDIEYPYKIDKKYLTCPECGEEVAQRKWQQHQDKHAGKKSECDVCHKQYSSRTTMLQHKQRVHSTGRRHECGYCGKAFFVKCELTLHIRTHTGEKPFKCEFCDYRVAHKGNLKVHFRQVHQNQSPDGKRQKKSKGTKGGKGTRTGKKKKVEESDSSDE